MVHGRGATLWGSNAVNGAINILTDEAKDFQGGQLVLGAGNELDGYVFRYGDQFLGGHYYVWGNHRAVDPGPWPDPLMEWMASNDLLRGSAWISGRRVPSVRPSVGACRNWISPCLRTTRNSIRQRPCRNLFAGRALARMPACRPGLQHRGDGPQDWQFSAAYGQNDGQTAMGLQFQLDTLSLHWRGQMHFWDWHHVEVGTFLQRHKFDSVSTVPTGLNFTPTLPVFESVSERGFIEAGRLPAG